jgi:hypothetical protein
MRVVYCFCGHRIEGINDTNLFQRYRDHQYHAHPANQSTDMQIWSVIKASAHEKRDVHYHEQAGSDHQTSAG